VECDCATRTLRVAVGEEIDNCCDNGDEEEEDEEEDDGEHCRGWVGMRRCSDKGKI